MVRTKKTTAQRVTQRQRAREKTTPTHKRLRVSRAGRFGASFRTIDDPVHSWPLIVKRTGMVAGNAENLEVLEYRRKQIVYARNLAVGAKLRALAQEQKAPGSANPLALSFSLAETKRNYQAAMTIHAKRKRELEKQAGNATKARHKTKVARKAKKRKKKPTKKKKKTRR